MDLLPGDVGFATIGGRTGALVNVGQALLRDSCRYTHAWIALDATTILEAMPGGARVREYSPDHDCGMSETCPRPVFRLPLEDETRAQIELYGPHHAGVPYSFADYAALALQQWAPRTRLARSVRSYVSSSGHMICSQLVDHVLCRAGYHLFDDGRLPQDVTPGDLFYRVSELGARVL